MRTKIILIGLSLAVFATGCTEKSETNIVPLMGLEWFSEISDVKDILTDYSLLQEREGIDTGNPQQLLDYSGTELFETACDLTLCFVEHGLVGFNYHDIEKNKSYNEWFQEISAIYGVPTEKGSGMASWYENPVGKNTALYLFNLEEGVQVSFYATSNTPDTAYKGNESGGYVPTPELRTPIVPVDYDDSEAAVTTGKSTASVNQEIHTSVITNEIGEVVKVIETESELDSEIIGENNEHEIASVSSSLFTSTSEKSLSSETVTTIAVPAITTQNKTEDFKQNVLQFYATPEFERKRMSIYNQVYEYKTEENGKPWELIMQYENVPYCNKNCDTVLCFTSLGLVGINYFDNDKSAYDYWVSELTEIYGLPTISQNDYTSWDNSLLGENITIYIFALEDGVQISFFSDDAGSELS